LATPSADTIHTPPASTPGPRRQRAEYQAEILGRLREATPPRPGASKAFGPDRSASARGSGTGGPLERRGGENSRDERVTRAPLEDRDDRQGSRRVHAGVSWRRTRQGRQQIRPPAAAAKASSRSPSRVIASSSTRTAQRPPPLRR
jgi:hypothetical protein